MIYNIVPIAKPRMTRRDKWLKPPRPVVQEYWDFCDKCGREKIRLDPSGCRVTFFLPMPKSWSEKKRRAYRGMPHMATPDLDNLLKGLFDALYEKDSIIWDIAASKLWEEEGKIIIEKEI
jgi:Holliday junction resolvase RusA-like endonuclease